MVAVKLELRCPKSVAGVVIDPQPDWTFDTLLSELNSIEKKLDESSVFPLPFTKAKSREFTFAKFLEKRAFIMRVDEMEDFEEEDSGEEDHNGDLLEGRRFACDEFYASDGEDSEDELPRGAECQLMEEVGLVESALSELTHEHQICVMEEIRNHICAVEMDLINEKKEFTSALAQVKKYIDTRREMDRKLDIQYQRRIAEALDNHLTAVQRDHEHKSQIEERRIKDDAAVEEAKRREKALQDEKLRQEKIRAEAEARVEAERKKAEEVKAAALEAEKKAAKEAAEKVASENIASAATSGVINKPSHKSGSNGEREVQQAGNLVKCAESALKLEERKQQIYKEIVDKNVALGLGPGSNFVNPGSKIKKLVRQINGIKENERNKVEQLSKIFLDPSCPQSISITSFAETIVYQSARPESAVFGYANVIVLLSSQVPVVMDLVLAKLNAVCIYTVPKYINYAKSAFDTRETYCKAIGYDGEDESEESYISRMESYMKLYGALVQTEIPGVRNTHGLEEGWAWLARFLNALPANIYTAAALQAFLEVAGFALYRRYKSQFKKLLNIIYRDFVNALKEQGGDPKLTKVTTSLQTYIESSMFLEEPKRRSVQGSLLSNAFVPELEYQYSEPSYNRPSNRFYYGY